MSHIFFKKNETKTDFGGGRKWRDWKGGNFALGHSERFETFSKINERKRGRLKCRDYGEKYLELNSTKVSTLKGLIDIKFYIFVLTKISRFHQNVDIFLTKKFKLKFLAKTFDF